MLFISPLGSESHCLIIALLAVSVAYQLSGGYSGMLAIKCLQFSTITLRYSSCNLPLYMYSGKGLSISSTNPSKWKFEAPQNCCSLILI